MSGKSHKGFTLIELLVVVAIIGVISAIGVISYTGYKTSTEKKAAENSLRSIYLAQQEYKASTGTYFLNAPCCTQSGTTNITKELFAEVDNLSKQEFYFGITGTSDTFTLTARKKNNTCTITLTDKNFFDDSKC